MESEQRVMLKNYLKKIHEITERGDATEQSYYSILEVLMYDFAKSVVKKDVKITTIPKKTDAGNPDFRLWDGKQHIIGWTLRARQQQCAAYTSLNNGGFDEP